MLPFYDESLYAIGATTFDGWSSLYGFIYSVLNRVFTSPVQSFYFLNSFISFYLVPILVYLLCRKIKFSQIQAVLFSLISLLAPWNFPSEPKLQVLNYCFLVWGFLLRDRKRLASFYFILTLSLFLRTDNIIILLTFYIFDLYQSIKDKQFKSILLSTFFGAILFSSLSLMWSFPFSSSRNYLAFHDHFSWRNESFLIQNLYTPGSSRFDQVKDFFHADYSLAKAIVNQPDASLMHFKNNLLDLPKSFLDCYKLLTTLPISVFYIFFLIIFIFNISSETQTLKKETYIDFGVFTLAIIIKCLSTSILLQPWYKYIFEATLLTLMFLCLSILIHSKWTLKPRLIVALPLLGLFLSFKTKEIVFHADVDLRIILHYVKEYEKIAPIRFGFSNTFMAGWYHRKFFGHAPNRLIDDEILKDFSNFLFKNQIDMVIIEPQFRYLYSHTKLKSQWENFEAEPTKYGFCLLINDTLSHFAIYVRNEDCSRIQGQLKPYQRVIGVFPFSSFQ